MTIRETIRDYWPRLSNAVIDDCERILSGESESDAVGIIQRIAEIADGAPTAAKVAEHLRALRAERALTEKAAEAHRARERDEAHFRLAYRMRQHVESLDRAGRLALYDAVLAAYPMDAEWVRLAAGWAKRNGLHNADDARERLVTSGWMAPITMQYLIDIGELDDREGAFDRTREEQAAGDEADRLIESKRRHLREMAEVVD
jgi:hypothetical protein